MTKTYQIVERTFIVVFILTPLSYFLALAGHPNSVWLWVDIFGVAL